MGMVLNTNIGAIQAQRAITESREEMESAMERLSTGKRINSAADDAAGLAMIERMNSQIRGLTMATKTPMMNRANPYRGKRIGRGIRRNSSVCAS